MILCMMCGFKCLIDLFMVLLFSSFVASECRRFVGVAGESDLMFFVVGFMSIRVWCIVLGIVFLFFKFIYVVLMVRKLVSLWISGECNVAEKSIICNRCVEDSACLGMCLKSFKIGVWLLVLSKWLVLFKMKIWYVLRLSLLFMVSFRMWIGVSVTMFMLLCNCWCCGFFFMLLMNNLGMSVGLWNFDVKFMKNLCVCLVKLCVGLRISVCGLCAFVSSVFSAEASSSFTAS